MKIGSIIFTDEGLSCIRKFDNVEVVDLGVHISYEEIRPWLVAFAERRIKHCVKQLENNFAKVKVATPEIVAWDGEHFSVPVYKSLQQFVGYKGNKSEFNSLICQQVIREIQRETTSIYKGDCSDDIYDIIRKSSINGKMVFDWLTEHLFCVCDEELFRARLGAL